MEKWFVIELDKAHAGNNIFQTSAESLESNCIDIDTYLPIVGIVFSLDQND